METINKFGNMMPPENYLKRTYLLSEKPFCIAGNLYYVGNALESSHLIDTGEGLILLDTPGLPEIAYLINNIWRAGFDPEDLKYIIVSHAHVDHYGSVNALVHLTGAKVFISKIDADDMKENPDFYEWMNNSLGQYNESFQPDVLLEDGDIVELGNTKIRCVLTPGHTKGTMSHFWSVKDCEQEYTAGIYGGSGFSALTDELLTKNKLPLSMKEIFLDSIEKVWNEKVDITLGNHPFHNDTFIKRNKLFSGDEKAFIDPTEWQRFLTELREGFNEFRKLSKEQVEVQYSKSQMLDYLKTFR